jgi:Uma2 family endonuclease
MAKGATLDDLRRVDDKAELVNGEIVRMTPAGFRHGYAASRISASLEAYAERTGHGYGVSDNVGFIVDLPHRRSFSPDAAYYLGVPTDDFAEGAPVFAVEIRSKEDRGLAADERLAAKRADYFAAGTLVVWDVDLERVDAVHAYRATDPGVAAVFRRGEIANAEPAVPGWSMLVDHLFAPIR